MAVARWGALALYALGFWLVLRKLPPPASNLQPGGGAFSRADMVAAALLLAMLLVLAVRHSHLFPVPPDGYYHLRVAQQIQAQGRIPLWNGWEFAPDGRPHLYPPAYPLLICIFSLLCGGDLWEGFQWLQALALPALCAVPWYSIRQLFGPRLALLALLVLGMDPYYLLAGATATPGALAGVLAVAMAAAFLRRRALAAGLLGAASLYLHPGAVPLTLAGLAAYVLWQRRQWRQWLLMAAVAALLAAPWYWWVLLNLDWFKHPLDLDIYGNLGARNPLLLRLGWLQLLHVGILLLALRGALQAPWRAPHWRALLCIVLAFLPVLFSYGGRYFALTLPWVAVLAARPLEGLAAPLSKRRLAVLALIVLAPAMGLAGFGSVVAPGPLPLPSAWWATPFAAAGGLQVLENGESLNILPYSEAVAVARVVEEQAPSDAIVVMAWWQRDVASAIGFFTGLRTSTGAWEETQPDAKALEAGKARAANAAHAVFISQSPRWLPEDVERLQVGNFFVGIRK